MTQWQFSGMFSDCRDTALPVRSMPGLVPEKEYADTPDRYPRISIREG
ncbi:MAG: hypothetical protein ACRERU_23900 [Methylococcales bacterium]